jgi:hypothetical protein
VREEFVRGDPARELEAITCVEVIFVPEPEESFNREGAATQVNITKFLIAFSEHPHDSTSGRAPCSVLDDMASCRTRCEFCDEDVTVVLIFVGELLVDPKYGV